MNQRWIVKNANGMYWTLYGWSGEQKAALRLSIKPTWLPDSAKAVRLVRRRYMIRRADGMYWGRDGWGHLEKACRDWRSGALLNSNETLVPA